MTIIKPPLWAVDPSLVSPRWRWFYERSPLVLNPWLDGGKAQDISQNRLDLTQVGTLSVVPSPYGQAVEKSASTDYARFPGDIAVPSGLEAVTMVVAGMRTADTTSYWEKIFMANSAPLFGMSYYGSTTGRWMGRLSFSVAGNIGPTSAGYTTIGEWYLLVLRWRYGEKLSNRRYALGTGELLEEGLSSSAIAENPTAHAASNYQYLTDASGSDPKWRYLLQGVWHDYISDSELEALAREPFGPITPAQKVYFPIPQGYELQPDQIVEGFRWRNDDGSESAATWAEIQDANHTLTPNDAIRLRLVIQGPAGGPYRLECAKVGTENWFIVK